MSNFKIQLKEEQIAQSFAVINGYANDKSAAEMVEHHRALVSRLNAEIKELKVALVVAAHGAAHVVSNMFNYIVVCGEPVNGEYAEDQVIMFTNNKRTGEKFARYANKI